MPHDLSRIEQLFTSVDVLRCLSEDPFDRIFIYGCDLLPHEFDNYGFTTRADTSILVVRSMRGMGAKSITEFVDAMRNEERSMTTQIGELAVVAEKGRDQFGRIIPNDIAKLLDDAEKKTHRRTLSWWKGYEALRVLAEPS